MVIATVRLPDVGQVHCWKDWSMGFAQLWSYPIPLLLCSPTSDSMTFLWNFEFSLVHHRCQLLIHYGAKQKDLKFKRKVKKPFFKKSRNESRLKKSQVVR